MGNVPSVPGLFPTSSDTNRYKFTGKERDGESGVDNFLARYNAPALGRFMSPDPDQASGFDHMGDPQAWNGYAYAGNNPLRNTDPDGRDYWLCDKNGNNCERLSDDQWKLYLGWLQSLPGAANYNVSASGQITYTNPENGAVTLLGTEQGFDANYQAQNAAAIVTFFAINEAADAAFGFAGARFFGWLGDRAAASAAARATADAAVQASEATSLATKAASTVGNQGAAASSKQVALAAAEEFVGPGAKTITDRNTGVVVGKISADGSKVYRITSINEAAPYVNLENKLTGGNLHVRF